MEKKRYHLYYLLIIISLFSAIFLSIENSEGYSYKYILKNKTRSLLNLTKDSIPETNSNIPKASLYFDDKWEAHLQELNKLVLNQNFDTYRVLNKYFDGVLTLDSKEYQVKIKVHGNEPDGHIYKNHVSLKVKFKTKKNPFKSKKIKLIIKDRIGYSFDNMKILGEFFSVYHTAGFWYNITVKNNNEYPYLVQIPMGKSYIKHYLKDSNLIDFSDAPYQLTNTKDTTRLSFKTNDSREKIIQLISNLRSDIKKGNSDQLFSYFDKDYITHFAACNLVGGFLGHGFNTENIYILFNKKTNKFHPLITRDNFISPIQPERNEFEQITYWEHFSMGHYVIQKNDLLTYLYRNEKLQSASLDLIDNKKTEDLIKVINKNQDVYQPSEFSINSLLTNQESNKFRKRLSWKRYSSDLIKENFIYIKNRIKNKSYSCHEFLANDSISILFNSHSVYPLYISEFSFELTPSNTNSITAKYYQNKQCLIDTLIQIEAENINLTSLLKNIPIFDLKDNGSSSIHQLKIYFNNNRNQLTNLYKKDNVRFNLSQKYSKQKEKIPVYIKQKQIINH